MLEDSLFGTQRALPVKLVEIRNASDCIYVNSRVLRDLAHMSFQKVSWNDSIHPENMTHCSKSFFILVPITLL